MSLRLNTVTWGVGTPTVVMLHGLGDGAFVWNHIAPVLASQMTVVAVELRGHGDSPHDPEGRYQPETYAEDVFKTMRALIGGRRVILIGHSLGATVAIHVASLARDQVCRLALVDGGPWLNPSALRHIHEQFLAQPWFHESPDSFAAQLQQRHPLSDPRLLQAIAGRALRPLPSGGYELKCDRQLLAAERAPEDMLLWEKLTAFVGPMLVVRGAGSAVLTRTGARRMADELPNCRLHTVPMAGHTVMFDNPEGLLMAIAGFLSGTSLNRAPAF